MTLSEHEVARSTAVIFPPRNVVQKMSLGLRRGPVARYALAPVEATILHYPFGF